MNTFSSDHNADAVISMHRHPSRVRRSTRLDNANRATPTLLSSGANAVALASGNELDAELRLLEAIARRGPATEPIRRTLTISARGQLSVVRVLWSGADGAWGVIEPLLAELMGWDAFSTRSVRADVHSSNGRHQVLEIHPLVVV